MMFAPHLQPPPRPVPLFRRVLAELGLWAMWAGFALTVLVVVLALVRPVGVKSEWLLAAPLIITDALFIWIHLGKHRDRALVYDGLTKTLFVWFFLVGAMAHSRAAVPFVPSLLDDLADPAGLLTGPVTFLAALLRRLGR